MIESLTQVQSIPGFSEPVSAISHLLGAGLFLALSWPLIRRGRGGQRLTCLAVFAFSCVCLLSVSGVYHILAPPGSGRAVLRRIDHAAIFLLIAGAFTPVHGLLFRGLWRWGMLAFIWGAAVTGITLKTIFFRGMPPWLGVVIYLAFGWLGLISAVKLKRRFGYPFIAPLVYGAVAYTIGAACLGLLASLGGPMFIPGVVGRHELFHFAVLAGIGFHWQFVYRIAGIAACPR